MVKSNAQFILPPQQGVCLSLHRTAEALERGDRSNEKLSFLLTSIDLISMLHPGAVIPHLEFLALVEVFLSG